MPSTQQSNSTAAKQQNNKTETRANCKTAKLESKKPTSQQNNTQQENYKTTQRQAKKTW